MAVANSTGAPGRIDVTTLGFVREIREIMETARCATAIDLDEAGTHFRIIIHVAQDMTEVCASRFLSRLTATQIVFGDL